MARKQITANESTADEGTANESTADEGTANESTADEGTANESTADEGTADEAGHRSQWAAEKARALAQGGTGKAAHRFAKLADVLVAARANGESRIGFADANSRADLSRGEKGDPAASWRLALQRTRQLFGSDADVAGWRVDSEARALVFAE